MVSQCPLQNNLYGLAWPNESERIEAKSRTQRNAIQADLDKIYSDLLHVPIDRLNAGQQLDRTTVLIVQWYQKFSQALRRDLEPQKTFNEFKTLLQQILVDTIFQAALNEDCLLGNDGEIYSEKGLQLFQSLAPVHLQNRSPLHPEYDRVFATAPHINARYMVRWLKRHNIEPRNPQNEVVEEAYRQLNLMANHSSTSNYQDDATAQTIEQRVQRQKSRESKREERVQARAKQIEDTCNGELNLVHKGCEQVAKKIDNVAREQLEKVDQFNRDIHNAYNNAIEKIDAEIGELNTQEKKLAEKSALTKQAVATLQLSNQNLATKAVHLKKQIDDVKNREAATAQIIAKRVAREKMRVQEHNARIQARCEQLELKRREELEPLVQNKFEQVAKKADDVVQAQLEKAHILNREVKQDIKIIETGLGHIEVGVIQLNAQDKNISQKHALIKEEITSLQTTNQNLSLEAVQLKKQIKENEKAGCKLVVKALITTAACAVGTIALNALMSAAASQAGAAASATPTAGGFKANVFFKF